jgi:20S proteasome alpha/beta subunit
MIRYPLSRKYGIGATDVTTIVGMICEDGLVLASDSKATKGPTAREEFLKIWDLNVGRFKAVITGAGRSAFIAKYRDLLQEVCAVRAQRQPIQTVPEFITLAEETMQNMSKQYGTDRLARLGVLRGPSGNDDDRSTTSFYDMLPDLMAVIGIHDKRPHLFFIPPDGIAEEQQLFGATGSGSPFAEYLLPKMCRSDFQMQEAALLAVHIIEQIKHVDPHSGGPTQLVTIGRSAVKHWNKSEISKAEERASGIEAKAAALWRRTARRKSGNHNRRKNNA